MNKLVLVLSSLVALFFVGCSAGTAVNTEKKEVTVQTKEEGKGKMAETPSLGKVSYATVVTNMGSFKIEFYDELAPKTVENFKGLSRNGYFNGVIFHRVIKGFVIQGGDPTGTGRGGQSLWGGKFKDEFTPLLRHDAAGILSMANAGPNTNGSQFFVTLAPTPHLNDRHSVFGKVVEGLDIVLAIGSTQTGPGDKPVKDVIITEVIVED